MPFSLERRGFDIVRRNATIQSRTWLSPNYVRLRLVGDELRGFNSAGCDDHLRILFADENGSVASREYTPLAWNDDEGTLDLEFVIHGDQGIAAPWAANAPIGDAVAVGGPRGSLVLEGHPDGWLLAGDETALPAMRRFISTMAPDAVGYVFVEVPDSAHEQQLDTPPGVALRWVYRGAGAVGSALAVALDELTESDRPEGDILVFIAAEQSIVKTGRALAFDRWRVAPEHAIIKGYWKVGTVEYHAPH